MLLNGTVEARTPDTVKGALAEGAD